MNNFVKHLLLIFLLFTGFIMPSDNLKNNNNGYKFWNLKSISGLLALEGNYRSGKYNLSNDFEDERTSTFLSGILELNTSSFFWHPNFFQLDANFSYSPIRNLDKYIISPDNSEINTTERIDINGIFFAERIISLNPYFSFNHSYNRREFTTNIESFYSNYGNRLFSYNSIVPFNFNISQSNWEEKEIQTLRRFETDQFSLNTEFSKSFSNISNNRLNIDYLNYSRSYATNSVIQNKSMNWRLSNNFNPDGTNNINYSSFISLINQTGTQPFNRFLVNENLRTNLPYGFTALVYYRYYKVNQQPVKSDQHDVEGKIEHQLFESLRSHLSFKYVNVSQTFYNEKIYSGEAGFDYIKKIPTGIFRLNYSFSLSEQKRDNLNAIITIVDESVKLSDETITVLNSPYVDINSISVKNLSGTIIFQGNFDYILVPRGSYVEIQRIPGGQITNGETVLVSYNAEQQPSISFNTSINRYGSSISLFNNFLELYFQGTDQNFSDVYVSNLDYLKILNQKIYGLRISYEYLDAGAEYENYQSNITPFTSNRFFARIYRQTSDNFIASINGNYRIYNLLEDNTKQYLTDVSLSLGYLIGSKSRISFQLNSIIQNGKQIDLDLNMMRLEFTTSFRQVELLIGYENYYRKLLADVTKYSGVFIKIARRF